MLRKFIFIIAIVIFSVASRASAANFEADTIKTTGGNLVITCIGHGTLMFTFNDKVVHIDPIGQFADYNQLPKADIILVTHEHGDHLDMNAIEKISQEGTKLIVTKTIAEQPGNEIVMQNGDSQTILGIGIKAVPAYNIVSKRGNGQPYHAKGVGNGYILTFGDKNIYVAGDTENIPEMADLKNIYCAFLPMNVPFTMTPEMVAAAAKVIKPAILYPYHFGTSNTGKLLELLNDEKDIKVRIRKLQ